MTKFLRLSGVIINTAQIVTIDILPKKYIMNMCEQNIKGLLLFSFGSLNSNNTTIEVCENKHPIDYQLVKEWIRQII